MKHPWFLAVIPLSIFVLASCAGTSTVPRSPSSETSNSESSTTQPGVGASVADAETVATVAGPTTTSMVVDGSASTTEPDGVDAGANDENPEQSETNQTPITSATSPSAPTTTYGIVTEEPADVFSGGVETWEPDA